MPSDRCTKSFCSFLSLPLRFATCVPKVGYAYNITLDIINQFVDFTYYYTAKASWVSAQQRFYRTHVGIVLHEFGCQMDT